MTPLLVTLLAWALTFAIRYAGLSLHALRLTPFWLAFLRFVPISVFSALVVPDVTGARDWPLRALACALAALTLWRVGALWLGLLVGLGAYLLLRWLA